MKNGSLEIFMCDLFVAANKICACVFFSKTINDKYYTVHCSDAIFIFDTDI